MFFINAFILRGTYCVEQVRTCIVMQACSNVVHWYGSVVQQRCSGTPAHYITSVAHNYVTPTGGHILFGRSKKRPGGGKLNGAHAGRKTQRDPRATLNFDSVVIRLSVFSLLTQALTRGIMTWARCALR